MKFTTLAVFADAELGAVREALDATTAADATTVPLGLRPALRMCAGPDSVWRLAHERSPAARTETAYGHSWAVCTATLHVVRAAMVRLSVSRRTYPAARSTLQRLQAAQELLAGALRGIG
jgi:hypothetical protein